MGFPHQSCSGTRGVEEMVPAPSSGFIHVMRSHGAGSYVVDASSLLPLAQPLHHFTILAALSVPIL